MSKLATRFQKTMKVIGPGIITGAADDDPSGIATYSQTGAQFGYQQLWTALYMLPFLIAVQEACARIGAATGQGIAAVIRQHYNKWVLWGIVSLLVIANTINIGADIGAMAAATALIVPLHSSILAILFTALMLILIVSIPYKKYANILKWLCLSLLMYPLSVILVTQPWSEIIRATFIPHFEFTFAFLFIITGVLGTTISPYMFFWQASEENEEERVAHMMAKDGTPRLTPKFLRGIRLDTVTGMLFSEVATWSIILVAGTVLHTNGITTITTAADAARALEPLVQTFPNAGYVAKLIFSLGIIGLGLLSVPVLAGSAAYATAEAFHWHEGINKKLKRAPGFYGVIIAATLVGLAMNFLGINPMTALVYTAVINGVIAVPLIAIIWLIARNPKIMNGFHSGKLSNLMVLLTLLGMGAAVVAMLVTMVT